MPNWKGQQGLRLATGNAAAAPLATLPPACALQISALWPTQTLTDLADSLRRLGCLSGGKFIGTAGEALKSLLLIFVLGALISCPAIGVFSGFARADALHLDFQRIARTTSEGSVLARTAAKFGASRDTDALFGIDLRRSKTRGSQWHVDTDGVRSGLPAAVDVLAQTDGEVTLPVQQANTTNEAFDCYAVEPRSHYYEIGNYAQAFKEIQVLATEQCPQAAHLLAVMYAKGQGVKQDLVRAYALLLVAFSEGVTPFGGSGTGTPLLGDDSEEFEIVQFGAQLTDEQLVEAERLASTIVSRHAIAENGAIGPSGIADAIKELAARLARYKLNGKLAALKLPGITGPLLKGMKLCGRGRILAQLVREANSGAVPHQLLFIETKMKDVPSGVDGGNQALKREIDIASAQGETLDCLQTGEAVQIIRFGVNAGFASQIELSDGRLADAPGQKYWVDNCFLEMKDPKDQRFLQTVRAEQCR